MILQHGSQSFGDQREPLLQRLSRGGADHTMRQNAMLAAVAFDHAPAGALGSAIDPQNTHDVRARPAPEAPQDARASISFSSMSKFEYTFWTSSCSSRASLSLSMPLAFLPSSFIRFLGTIAISAEAVGMPAFWMASSTASCASGGRSEERRVGKECRARWGPDD